MATRLKVSQNYNRNSDCCHASQTQSSVTFSILTQLLAHIKPLPASFQLKQPCKPGQQYTTPHENEVSHSDTRHGFVRVSVCVVVLQTVLCSLFMSSQLDPILSLLGLSQKKFCSPQGGRKNRKLHSFITITEMLQAGNRLHPSKITEENWDLKFHSEVSYIKYSRICAMIWWEDYGRHLLIDLGLSLNWKHL